MVATKKQEEIDDLTVEPSLKWISSGTEKWNDFSAFIFGNNGIHIFFSPYQVDWYAAGPHFAEVPYSLIKSFMKEEYVGLLNISHYK